MKLERLAEQNSERITASRKQSQDQDKVGRPTANKPNLCETVE
jgi:hypothetical protein